jgi:integrase
VPGTVRPNPMSAPVSGTVECYEGKRVATWYVRWRDHTGQHRRRLGPAWMQKGPPDPGFFREREARAALAAILTDARRGATEQARTGLTFAVLAEEWLAAGSLERDWSHNTEIDYRSVLNCHLLPQFGELRVEAISAARIERWRNELINKQGLSRRNANKVHGALHAIFERAREHHGLQQNPAAEVRKLRESYDSARFEFYTPEEVTALAETTAEGRHHKQAKRELTSAELTARKAQDAQDAVLFQTAAFTGLRRGELLALRWGEVDFENHAIRVIEGYTRKRRGRTKSRKARTVPMVQEVAKLLQGLQTRGHHAERGDLVFVSESGGHVDASALRRRYIAARNEAGIRPLRFHDLRHTFGSLAINRASIVQVQAWMGHADIKTTMRYLHHKSRADEAQLLAGAFQAGARADPAARS